MESDRGLSLTAGPSGQLDDDASMSSPDGQGCARLLSFASLDESSRRSTYRCRYLHWLRPLHLTLSLRVDLLIISLAFSRSRLSSITQRRRSPEVRCVHADGSAMQRSVQSRTWRLCRARSPGQSADKPKWRARRARVCHWIQLSLSFVHEIPLTRCLERRAKCSPSIYGRLILKGLKRRGKCSHSLPIR